MASEIESQREKSTVNANLGCATTKELIQELEIRMEMERYKPSGTINPAAIRFKSNCNRALATLPDEILSYRTVNS